MKFDKSLLSSKRWLSRGLFFGFLYGLVSYFGIIIYGLLPVLGWILYFPVFIAAIIANFLHFPLSGEIGHILRLWDLFAVVLAALLLSLFLSYAIALLKERNKKKIFLSLTIFLFGMMIIGGAAFLLDIIRDKRTIVRMKEEILFVDKKIKELIAKGPGSEICISLPSENMNFSENFFLESYWLTMGYDNEADGRMNRGYIGAHSENLQQFSSRDGLSDNGMFQTQQRKAHFNQLLTSIKMSTAGKYGFSDSLLSTMGSLYAQERKERFGYILENCNTVFSGGEDVYLQYIGKDRKDVSVIDYIK